MTPCTALNKPEPARRTHIHTHALSCNFLSPAQKPPLALSISLSILAFAIVAGCEEAIMKDHLAEEGSSPSEQTIVQSSGKMVLVDKLLKKLKVCPLFLSCAFSLCFKMPPLFLSFALSLCFTV